MAGEGAQANSPYGGCAAGPEVNLYGVASLQQQYWLFETLSQGHQRKKGVLADPVLEGQTAEATAANAYTLNLWVGDEDHILTKRQRKRGSERTIRQSLQDFSDFFLWPKIAIFFRPFHTCTVIWNFSGLHSQEPYVWTQFYEQ